MQFEWRQVPSGCVLIIDGAADSIWDSVEIFGVIDENAESAFLNDFGHVRRCSVDASNWREILQVNNDCSEPEAADDANDSTTVDSFIEHLSAAVAARVQQLPLSDDREQSDVAVLFSGGVDSLLLAVLAHRHIRPECPIDLINVAFGQDDQEKFDVPDRRSGLSAFEALKAQFPERRWQMVIVNVRKSELQRERRSRISRLVRPCDTVLDDSIGCVIWFAAQAKGFLLDTEKQYRFRHASIYSCWRFIDSSQPLDFETFSTLFASH